MTTRQSDIVGGPAEQKVRAFLRARAGEWVSTADVRKGTGLAPRVVDDLLLILALQDEINREPDPARDRAFLWWMPPLAGIPYAYHDPQTRTVVCPACSLLIAEDYDADGKRTSSNYADHYQREHQEPKP